MEVLKITSTCLFVVGLGVPKYFRNKALVLFVSTFMAVALFYIGFGKEILNFIINRNIGVLSIGFACFNLAALFMGCWLSCIIHETISALCSF
ncbi:uncharacterized protein Eint_040085 [Encephalitozoon intestinalis ATCC 50506]|uniref:Uncharacterized protein n=1 Tax=Encephalitozoon intestinalis (strain ATCC 50506) TaxID=876142 RepID=W8PGM9_ENCIT|nr:uncharacterized protein Eint_040085 [Encephalitozoon intestinalis ATCC 50506]AHL30086.1 hypothetical protein Eint_040085 [Encephalitozoon intestinalis ATCC 50506]UTX44987.1 hypothetical protein GPK93_04g05200 [Encephalitozoon intestinalis]